MKNIAVTLLFIGCIFLAACEKEIPTPPLPQGVQTLSGTLIPTDLDLLRRGSHVLKQKGVDQYFVESSTVNLRAYENKLVTLRGLLEHNTEPTDLPVLIAESILDVEHTTKEWELRGLGLSLVTPRDWRRSIEGSDVFFFIDETVTPVISFTEGLVPEELPEGTSIVVGGRPGILIVDETSGAQAVGVIRDEKLLTIRFNPREYPNQEELKAQWLSMLHSIHFAMEVRSSSSARQATGTGSGVPCGGAAGILCRDGYYCAIRDFKENIGVCRRIGN